MLNDRKQRIKNKIQAKIGACARVVVRKTLKFFYAEVVDDQKRVIFGARIEAHGDKFDADQKVLAKKVVEFCTKGKIEKVAFDRNGYRYHGKVKQFADDLRAEGMKI